MANILKDFLIELGTNKNLKKKYDKNPEKTMDDYGLSSQEKEWILTGDTAAIDTAIGNDFYSITFIDIIEK